MILLFRRLALRTHSIARIGFVCMLLIVSCPFGNFVRRLFLFKKNFFVRELLFFGKDFFVRRLLFFGKNFFVSSLLFFGKDFRFSGLFLFGKDFRFSGLLFFDNFIVRGLLFFGKNFFVSSLLFFGKDFRFSGLFLFDNFRFSRLLFFDNFFIRRQLFFGKDFLVSKLLLFGGFFLCRRRFRRGGLAFGKGVGFVCRVLRACSQCRFQLLDAPFHRLDRLRVAARGHMRDHAPRQFVCIDARGEHPFGNFIRECVHARAQLGIDRRILSARIAHLAQDLVFCALDAA